MKRIFQILLYSLAGFVILAFFFLLDGFCYKNKIVSTPGPVLLSGIAISVIAITVYALTKKYTTEKKRKQALMEIAEKEKLSFSEEFDVNDPILKEDAAGESSGESFLDTMFMPRSSVEAALASFDTAELVDRANGLGVKYSMKDTKAYIGNVLGFDSEDISFRVFDRHIVTGEYREKYRRKEMIKKVSAAVIKFRNKVLPEFWLCPETLAIRLADKLTGADIDFDEAPVFSEKYRLTSTDVKVHKVFTSPVLACFERHTGLTVESDFNKLYVFNENIAETPEQVKDFYYAIKDIAFTVGRFSGK